MSAKQHLEKGIELSARLKKLRESKGTARSVLKKLGPLTDEFERLLQFAVTDLLAAEQSGLQASMLGYDSMRNTIQSLRDELRLVQGELDLYRAKYPRITGGKGGG